MAADEVPIGPLEAWRREYNGWPSRQETWYLTVVVLVVAGAIGLFLGGVDMFFTWGLDHTLLR